jgi:sugar lactone lactonase YvrE
VSVKGGRVFAILGEGLSEDELFGRRAGLLGKLIRLRTEHRATALADLAAFEFANNPDGGEVDENPYGVLALTKRHHLVVDAGGNSLLSVSGGSVSTVAVFPSQLVDAPPFLGLPPGTQIPAESVPTSVAVGPDGAYYVGELTGFPFPPDKARVWRVEPGGQPEVFADGFTNIIDLTFGRDGSLYVLEIAKAGLLAAEAGGDATGALLRLAPDGTRTEIASEGLVSPGGVAVARDGTIYVTNYSVFKDRGEVVRIRE